MAGTQLDILCETGSSNPQSVVTWWRYGLMLTGHDDGIVDGLFGGKITRNILRLNVTSQDDGTVITCQGKLPIPPAVVIRFLLSIIIIVSSQSNSSTKCTRRHNAQYSM